MQWLLQAESLRGLPSSLEHSCPHRAIILISISSKVADEFTTSVASFGCLAFDWTQLKWAIMLWRFMPLRVNQRTISVSWKSLSFLVYASTIVSEGFHFSSCDKLRCTEDVWDVFRMSCQVCVVYEPFLFVKGCFFANRATAQARGTIWEELIAWTRFCFIPKQFCLAILPSLTLLEDALVGFIRMREELQYNVTNCICLPARLFLKVFTLVQAINRDAPRTIGMCSGWDSVKYALFMSLPCSSRDVSLQIVQLPKHLEPSGKRW